MNSKYFRLLDPVLAGLGLAVMTLLTGCLDSPPWGSMSRVPSAEQFQAARGRQSSYVYFASYEIYYESTSRQYTYREDNAWVTRPEPPRGVPVELLETSPSVAMSFQDAPEIHHAAVVQIYPRNWGRSDAIMASAH